MNRWNKQLLGHGNILLVTIIFGLNTPVCKLLMPDPLDPYSLTIIRIWGAAVLFWLVSLFVPRERVSWSDLGMIFGAMAFGIVLNQFAFFEGLSMSSPIDASIVLTNTPIFTMVLAAFFLNEPITLKKVIGIVVGAAGALWLVMASQSGGNNPSSLIGILLCIVSSLSYATYLTLFRNVIIKYHPVTLMKWIFLFATVVCTPFCLDNVEAVAFEEMSPMAWISLAAVVFFATFVAYLLVPIAQRQLRPTTLSMYNYLQPIVGALVAIGFGLDTLTWNKIIATALVFLGVYIVTQSKSVIEMKDPSLEHPHDINW